MAVDVCYALKTRGVEITKLKCMYIQQCIRYGYIHKQKFVTMYPNFPQLKNDNIIKAARGQPVSRLPVWIMRQAGRYLPEFREIREKHDFFTICSTPELACEVTLQPLNRFDLDAAIIFSDILVIPQALGMEVKMILGIGPKFTNPLNSTADLNHLNWTPNIHKELSYVYDAIKLTSHKLDGRLPLIGFTGAPWTLMSYMIEGSGSNTYSKSKKWLYNEQESSHKLLNLLTNSIIEHLIQQVLAGAQLLQVFESHAGALSPYLFDQFALPYLKEIAYQVKNRLIKEYTFNLENLPPLIIFAKDGHYAIEKLSQSGYDVISLDWTLNPQQIRSIVGPNITLQGNLDPCALYASESELRKYVKEMLDNFGSKRYIVNLGHGIYPDTDPHKVKLFIDSVHQLSQSIN